MLWIIPALIVVFFAVLLIRTLRFQPAAQEPVADAPVELNEEKIVRDMQDMVRCKTVSNRDPSKMDLAEFEKFHTLLAERFPLIHQQCSLQKLGLTGLLYHLPGKTHDKVGVCMAHYDVVPAEEADWVKPAFEGILEDGVIWGRGTLDTKVTLCGVMEALEALLQKGYVPAHDLYLSFSGDEEVDGASCPAIVEWFARQGITPDWVVDEGGAVVDRVFPGYNGQCALIGIAEKGSLNVEFSMHSQGGHASTPPTKQLLGHLSRALLRVESKPFPFQLTKPVAEMFNTVGRHSNFLFRMIFANLWCFKPVLNLVGKLSGGELNAMMRTTVALTRFEGSDAYNVMPPKASFGANLRLLGDDTMDSAAEYLKKAVNNEKITITKISGTNPSPCSELDFEGWDLLKTAIRQTWPDAVVSPYLMMACSDSRHYNRITDRVYRFSAMHLSKEERGLIHGNNERIPVETLLKTAAFYVRLLQQV
jgi:carboxypeptidase PM20D1